MPCRRGVRVRRAQYKQPISDSLAIYLGLLDTPSEGVLAPAGCMFGGTADVQRNESEELRNGFES